MEAENVSRERLEEIIAEAYQVVGSLASSAGLFDDPQVQRALDILANLSDGSMLPFTPEPKFVMINEVSLSDLASERIDDRD